MVILKKNSVMVLAWVFLSAKMSVNGSGTLCANDTVVNLTEETLHSSGFVTKAGKVFLKKTMWYVSGTRLGCSCDSINEICLRLCCPFDEIQVDGTCVEKNATRENSPRIIKSIDDKREEEIVSGLNSLLHIDDPCDFEWMTTMVTNNFTVLPNGSIHAPELGERSLSSFEDYCLFQEPESAYYSAKVCRPWVKNFFWDTFCCIVAALIMTMIFLVYSVVPELQNLHGMMFRSYLFSYVCTFLSAVVVQQMSQSEDHANLFNLFIYGMEYWGFSCVLWLNVMSFDIWRAIRSLRCIDSHRQERKKKTFIKYAIYAWGSSAVIISSYAAAMCYLPQLHDVIIRQIFRKVGRIGFKITIFLCNTFFYFSTAISIKQHKKDTASLADGVNKHHDAEQQWINLHVKLYLIMGGHMIPWISWDLWPRPKTTSALVTLEMLQSLLLFFVFLWKDSIKQSLLKRFEERSHPQRDAFNTKW